MHDERRGNVHGHALQDILDLEPRVDLVHRQRLKRVLERAHPLQPPEYLRDRVEVDEEACKGHLVQPRYRAEKDREAAVRYGGAEEEVLANGTNMSANRGEK
jgi:hypothetical protein